MNAPDLRAAVGNREAAEDVATASSVAAMIATLDRDDPPPRAGDAVPPLWHWMYFAPKARPGELGPDGHPRRGGFIPAVALPRRMFAGGRATFHAPLRIGETIRREGEVKSVAEKSGRSGPLVFVTVGYRVFGASGLAIEEEHDLVYREAAAGAGAPAPERIDDAAGDGWDWRRTLAPDPVMLFRYSALTFNGHRIHYDQPYATGTEGYPGLVVHGPLLATLLCDLARDGAARPVRRFQFRARSPLFAGAPLTVSGRAAAEGETATLAATGADGTLAMTAEATFG